MGILITTPIHTKENYEAAKKSAEDAEEIAELKRSLYEQRNRVAETESNLEEFIQTDMQRQQQMASEIEERFDQERQAWRATRDELSEKLVSKAVPVKEEWGHLGGLIQSMKDEVAEVRAATKMDLKAARKARGRSPAQTAEEKPRA